MGNSCSCFSSSPNSKKSKKTMKTSVSKENDYDSSSNSEKTMKTNDSDSSTLNSKKTMKTTVSKEIDFDSSSSLNSKKEFYHNLSTMTVSEVDSSRKWADLPSDIILNVVEYIDHKADLPHLQALCSSWKSAFTVPVPLNSNPPSQIVLPDFFVDDHNPNPLYLHETRYYLLSRANDDRWLIRVADYGDRKWQLLNTASIAEELRYFYAEPPITGNINIMECRCDLLCISWSLYKPKDNRTHDFKSKKVVGGSITNFKCRFAVLAQLVGDGTELMLWRMGDDSRIIILEETVDPKWMTADLAYFDGEFFAFDYTTWSTGVIKVDDDADEPKMLFFPTALPRKFINGNIVLVIDKTEYLLQALNLVPTDSHLYLVLLVHAYNEAGDDAAFWADVERYRAIFYYALKRTETVEKYTWERVLNSIEDNLFIGSDSCFALRSASKPGKVCLFTQPVQMIYEVAKPNIIDDLVYPNYSQHITLYKHIKDEEKDSLLPYVKVERSEEYASLLFPPPHWVTWRCPSRDNAVVTLHDLKI